LAETAAAATDYERIADSLRARDHSAMADLYDALSERAFGLAFRILGDRASAEDAIQDAFLTVWRQAEQVDGARGKLVSYVLTIVHHRAIDIARRRQGLNARLLSVDPQDLHLVDDESAALISDADAAKLRMFLADLPDEQRTVIELAYFEGLSYSEVARRLNLPPGTVKSRMRLGLARLRKIIAEVGYP
jgi:RNA polymerase sigma-70 factor (ECF subfamily)